MKKNLLLIIMCLSAVLTAQGENGVTVSKLAVGAGMVTFDISWKNTGMPALWHDTVWVFVDYNDAGTMKRLPLLPGATLTAISAPGAGKVMEVSGNNKGVWVVGNARSAGSFSATVKLLTATAVAAGACAYASNCPPVGKYTSATNISFTGTPPYDLVLKHTGSATTVTQMTGASFIIPAGYTLQSFTDKTGATGMFTCTPPPATYTLTASNSCAGATLTLSGSQSGWNYQLYKGGAPAGETVTGTGGVLTLYDTPAAAGGFTYTVRRTGVALCETQVSGARAITVYAKPTITTHPTASSAICPGGTTHLSVTASNATAYQWKKNGANVSDGTGGTTANYTTAALNANATYTVVVSNSLSACSVTSNNALVTIYTVTPGAITTASTTTNIGTAPGVTVQSASPASGGSGNLTYLWTRRGSSAATLTGSNATYALSTDAANYSTAGTCYFNRYVKDNTCNTVAAAPGTYTLMVKDPYQPQGSCTFTPPPLVGTFAGFDRNYSASTYVMLLDERDGKYYEAVKIGDRWIMARNLNYQKDLTWQANADQPSTVNGQNLALIGHFWCPGGVNGSTSSTRASCEVWGALYSWETAMMLDGKWTSSGHSSSAWTERTNYGTSTSSGNWQNHGQSDAGATINGRGICPPNWHVPTDEDWGVILNTMETCAKYHNITTAWIGTDTGPHSKSKCTCASGCCSSDTDVSWCYAVHNQGTDVYSFRVLPAGYRSNTGSEFDKQGGEAFFWSSSAYNHMSAWYRQFHYFYETVYRSDYYRSFGFSVRCIRN